MHLLITSSPRTINVQLCLFWPLFCFRRFVNGKMSFCLEFLLLSRLTELNSSFSAGSTRNIYSPQAVPRGMFFFFAQSLRQPEDTHCKDDLEQNANTSFFPPCDFCKFRHWSEAYSYSFRSPCICCHSAILALQKMRQSS
ncbi:uncharacterized protein LOC108998353 isoform X2 [Juglans regia]|uniref:Uncharacterized protein LOC108998353 isoform X2 n=1 Tax=Juglans regia TaxID=51240 RepID=A0A6P9EFF3_JUGRE|nr:uncharacterized protein LOC108998353 isoform X2 [Juglans regia]